MNTFFKSTVYAAFVGLTIFSSCSDEIKDFTVKPDGTEQGDGSTTTAEIKNLIINATATGKKWVVEDVIYVGSPSAAENEVTIDNQSSGFTKFTVSKIGEGATSASFEGEIPANLSGKKLLVFYGNAADMKVAASKVTLDLASQNGTLMSATADYTGEESINATFSVENASAELKIQTTDVSGLTEATLSFDESSTMGFTSSKEFTAEGVGTYTMQKSMTTALTAGEDNEYTISFIPTVSETPATMNISLKAAKASGDYTYKTTKEISSSSNYDVEIKSENVDNSLFGAGTEESPYIIDNVDKFMGMTETTDKFYQLSRDLDFNGIVFTPITTFAGTFDGNGMTISNLTFSTTNDNGGIFAENTGTIKDLTASKVIITQEGSIAADKGVGILVGTNAKTISNSSVINSSSIKATITTGSAQGNLGLLAGFNKGTGSIKECKVSDSSITISEETASKTNLGGFAGKSLGSVTFSSANNVTVSHECDLTGGGSNIGGFLGYGNGTIEGCSSNTQISDAQTIGTGKAITIAGFIGTTWIGSGTVTIKGCYASGTVTSKLVASTNGGFIGNCTTSNNGSGNGTQVISNCYTSVILTDADTKFNGSAFIKTIHKVTATECYYVNGTQTIPSGKEENLSIVQKSAADLKGMADDFNSGLNWTDYQFVAGTDAEPLIITRK